MTGLTLENVVLRRGGRTILNQVNLRVDGGSFLAIVGPNGSGKSSMLKVLAGLWERSDGSVRIGEKPLDDLSRREVAQIISYVSQDTRMDFAFSVEETVAMGRHPRRGRFAVASALDHQAVERALEECDIGHLRQRFVTTLSGGERQRVAIARSLAVEPEIILLDEPTASLDIEHSLEVLDLCRKLTQSGKTIILATHDLNAVARYAEQVALIDAGKIAYIGGCSGVLNSNVLSKVFGVRAELLQSASGHPVYVFQRNTSPEAE